ncbi:MAG: alkaline phosphatase family protein [Planctomycetota bacterium]|nr:MAG: alkaline phosphatase family protein [Planctomycetota bacterium]
MTRKVLIIGLDGATFDVIKPLMEEGWMPNLAKLVERSVSGPMRSTSPPLSGPAWLSLATGMKPEKTSVYDFCNRKDNSYRLQGITSADCTGRAIWDYLSKAEKRVGILNYPICIPPYAVNGFMTAGFLASPNSEFTFPVDLKQELSKVVGGAYELSVPYYDARYDDTDLFLNDIHRVLDKKLRATAYLLRKKQWDLFLVVISETDWLQHIMWRHLDKNHPLHEGKRSVRFHQRFKEFWRRIDDAIGGFNNVVGKQTNIVILSDHGFGPNDEVFKLNVWLEREGYLVWRERQNKALSRAKKLVCIFGKATAKDIKLHRLAPKLYKWGRAARVKLTEKIVDQIDLERSIAFDPGHTIPFGGIYINDRLVDVFQRKQLIKEIAEKLRSWGKSNNVNVTIWQSENSVGEAVNTAPDLMVGIDDWRCVMPKGRSDGEIFERRPYSSRHTGSHRMNGIFIASGPDIQKGVVDNVHICDIAPTLLYLFDQPVPSDIDGQVMKGIFTAEYLANHPVKLQTNPQDYKCPDTTNASKTLTAEEEDSIHQQLKDLGYM